MKAIKLGGMGGGYVALVSDKDYARVNKFAWRASPMPDSTTIYAVRTAGRRPKRTTVRMHRYILRLRSRKRIVDHKNHDGLNNTRRNIRACTQTQNRANQRAIGCKGVIRLKRPLRKPFRAAIKKHRKVHYLGHFATRQEGMRAYNRAAVKLFGRFACLNPETEAAA